MVSFIFIVGAAAIWLIFFTHPPPVDSTGSSTLCTVNRVSIYLLLGILINLCALMYQIASALLKATAHKNKGALNFLCIAIPTLLAVLGFVLEDDGDDVENAQLNIARHAFSCEMR